MNLVHWNTETGAIFSECRTWRYVLWRNWQGDKAKFCAFVGLNPSTADETTNDPTVQRCINYAKSWGFGGMFMLNCFAYRATDPKDMKAHDSPVGPENDMWLARIAQMSQLVVCAWGNHATHLGRANEVLEVLPRPLHALKMTGQNQPGHPLYLRADLKPFSFTENKSND